MTSGQEPTKSELIWKFSVRSGNGWKVLEQDQTRCQNESQVEKTHRGPMFQDGLMGLYIYNVVVIIKTSS
jgi:hypothetical protein